MTRPTWLLGVLAAVAVTTTPVAAADPCGGRVLTRRDGWVEVKAPDFPAGKADIRMLEVAPLLPSRMFVSDGITVLRTLDGGCRWTPIYQAARLVQDIQIGNVGAEETIFDVAVPMADDERTEAVYVVSEFAAAATSRTNVAFSDDDGRTFTPGAGLPPSGRPRAFAVAPSAWQRAYVAIEALDPNLPVGGAGVWGTDDGGRTWRRATALDGAIDLVGLRVDPLIPTHLFGWNSKGLYESTDAGVTFRKVAGVEPGVRDVALGYGPEGSRVVVAHADSAVLSRSTDGGRSWTRLTAPDVVDSVATTPIEYDVTVTTGTGSLSVLYGTLGARTVRTDGGPPVEVFAVSDAGKPQMIGRLPRALIRRPITFPAVSHKEKLLPVELGVPTPVKVGTARLAPERTTVTLRPGESRQVPYQLDLPPVPTPLDVFFLVDTTGSMGGTINGLRSGIGRIVRELAESGIDAQFGIGSYRDYPFGDYGSTGDYPYKLHRAIGPVNDELRQAIASLQAGGGGDGPESTLPALFQSVTGAGDSVGDVPRGQDAKFRADALRVIVVATDNAFHSEAGYPGPSRSRVYDVLRKAKVHVVGLAVLDGGRPDLEDVAGATGTFAPAGGVDCNRDRVIDVQSGRPLVCTVFETVAPVDLGVDLGPRLSIAPAIVSMLRAVRDLVPVELVSSDPAVARVVVPAAPPQVDVKKSHRLHFTVEARCAPGPGGKSHPVRLTAARPGRELGRALLDVRCLPAVPPARRDPPAAAPAVHPVVAAVAPVPPPIELAPQLHPNPQANPNPQPNLNAQTGLATETEEQYEVALAYADTERAAGEEFAAVAVSPYDVAAVQVLGAGLALAMAAGAWALRSRTATRPAVARVRSRR